MSASSFVEKLSGNFTLLLKHWKEVLLTIVAGLAFLLRLTKWYRSRWCWFTLSLVSIRSAPVKILSARRVLTRTSSAQLVVSAVFAGCQYNIIHNAPLVGFSAYSPTPVWIGRRAMEQFGAEGMVASAIIATFSFCVVYLTRALRSYQSDESGMTFGTMLLLMFAVGGFPLCFFLMTGLLRAKGMV